MMQLKFISGPLPHRAPLARQVRHVAGRGRRRRDRRVQVRADRHVPLQRRGGAYVFQLQIGILRYW